MKNLARQFSSFIVPVILTTLAPVLIARSEHHAKNLLIDSSTLQILAGSIVTLAGLLLFIVTVITFIRIGNGTIMPWDPPQAGRCRGLSLCPQSHDPGGPYPAGWRSPAVSFLWHCRAGAPVLRY